MIAFNVKSNVKQFVKGLDRIQKRQVPFATTRALTWTAKEAQKKLQDAMPSTFNVTKKWWLAKQPTGIKVKSAKKADLEAVVYTLAYFAKLQEDGGIKLPFAGRGIMVPGAKVPKYGRKAGGATKVLAGKKILRSGGTGAGDPVVSMPSGKRGVFRRRGKKRLPVDLLYSYVPRAHIRARMRFKARAYHTSVKAFDRLFAKSLSMALKTAR